MSKLRRLGIVRVITHGARGVAAAIKGCMSALPRSASENAWNVGGGRSQDRDQKADDGYGEERSHVRRVRVAREWDRGRVLLMETDSGNGVINALY